MYLPAFNTMVCLLGCFDKHTILPWEVFLLCFERMLNSPYSESYYNSLAVVLQRRDWENPGVTQLNLNLILTHEWCRFLTFSISTICPF
uniref:Uncharacterized protein n=1 Tax=Triticum urartu TaxID=4572 RepID=A0A8R7UGH9_TRIUA